VSAHIGIVLLVVGAYTVLALPQLFAPRLFLARLTFGVQTDDAFTLLLARHWALLAALVGGLLLYAAFHREVQGPALFLGAVEKLGLSALVFFGPWKRTPGATRLAAVDALMGLALGACLLGL
jgi:hypothetical protein